MDPYLMKDANLTILRAVLVVPTLIGCLMMCISIPQVPLINHEVAVMFITAAIPCCCHSHFHRGASSVALALGYTTKERVDATWQATWLSA